MVSGTLAVPKLIVLEIEGGSRVAAYALKLREGAGQQTYAFTNMGNFFLLLLFLLLLLCPSPQIRPLKSQPQGPNPSLKPQIPASL